MVTLIHYCRSLPPRDQVMKRSQGDCFSIGLFCAPPSMSFLRPHALIGQTRALLSFLGSFQFPHFVSFTCPRHYYSPPATCLLFSPHLRRHLLSPFFFQKRCTCSSSPVSPIISEFAPVHVFHPHLRALRGPFAPPLEIDFPIHRFDPTPRHIFRLLLPQLVRNSPNCFPPASLFLLRYHSKMIRVPPLNLAHQSLLLRSSRPQPAPCSAPTK